MTPLVLVGDASLVELLGAQLGRLPGHTLRQGLGLGGLHRFLHSMLESRDGLERGPDGALPDWVHAALADYLATLGRLPRSRAVVLAAELHENRAVLCRLVPPCHGVLVVSDPRRAPLRHPDGDLVAAAIQRGQQWAASVSAAIDLPGPWSRVSTFAPTTGLPLPAGLPLQRPTPPWPGPLEAGLQATPGVAELLAKVGLPAPTQGPCTHPDAVAINLQDALSRDSLEDARAWLPHLPNPSTSLRSALLQAQVAARSQDTAAAAALLTPWCEAPEARALALSLVDEPISRAVATTVRAADPLPVRTAFARWLLAHGLDAEAAEVVAWVERTGWRDHVRVRRD